MRGHIFDPSKANPQMLAAKVQRALAGQVSLVGLAIVDLRRLADLEVNFGPGMQWEFSNPHLACEFALQCAIGHVLPAADDLRRVYESQSSFNPIPLIFE